MPTLASTAELTFYATPGRLTTLAADTELAPAPAGIAEVARIVQGVLLHDAWAARYGVDLTPAQRAEVELRTADAMVRRIRELDPAPLDEARPPERRLIGNCRSFSVLTCALLRQRGVPARARCGFGTYFEPGRFVAHWLVDHWDERAGWRRSDIQLDALQCGVLQLDFDPLDVPHGRYLSAGEAWQLCRAGQAKPEQFGIFEWWGDHVAALTSSGGWSAWRPLYEQDARLCASASFA
jgi:hypothetical protein